MASILLYITLIKIRIQYKQLQIAVTYNTINYKKYGVTLLLGITLSESGTAWNNFGSTLSIELNSSILAILPHR